MNMIQSVFGVLLQSAGVFLVCDDHTVLGIALLLVGVWVLVRANT